MARQTFTDRAEGAGVKRRAAPWAIPLLILGSVGACTCDAPPEQAGSTVPSSCQYAAPAIAPVETDILFVIDDSNSMSEEQEGVIREIPTFVSILEQGAGVGQLLRVGLVNTSVYEGFQTGNGSVITIPYDQGGWLKVFPAADGGTSDGSRYLTDPDPEIVPRLSAAIRALGINGSPQETPFEAARIALTETGFWTVLPDGGSPNAGFLRPGGRLLVVVASDEDDCSEMSFKPPRVYYNNVDGQDFCTNHEDLLTPVGDYVTAFTRLDDGMGRPREFLWGGIAPVSIDGKIAQSVAGHLGDGGVVTQNLDCPTSGGPGFRHRAMALAFDPTLTNLDSICKPDYHDSLVAIAQIASIPQTLTLTDNVPDPRLLQIDITRGDGTVQQCTLHNGGFLYEAGVGTEKPTVRFQQQCLRRTTDTQVTVKLLCAG